MSSPIFSQQYMGIMTENPKAPLHVSGPVSVSSTQIGDTNITLVTPTIRIDGLNMSNNPTVFTSSNTTNPLYVNSNGDLSVKKGIEIFGTYTLPGSDAITTSTTLNVTANETYQVTGDLLSTTFTLQHRSMVYISSSLSAEIQSSTGDVITDGKARSIAAVILFTAAPASSNIVVNSSYMSDGITYSNRRSASLNRSFTLCPTSEVLLPPGTYTVALRGAGIAGNNSPAENFRVIWGGGSNDKLNILAKPL